MSRRRRKKQGPEDSFDLFLDTITNTFGGVLLIALLIVLLIRENNQSQPQDKQTSISAELVQSEIDLLNEKSAKLERDLKAIDSLNQDFSTTDLTNLAAELRGLARKVSQQELKRKDIQSAARSLDTKTKEIEKDSDNLANAKIEVAKLKTQLSKEQAERTRTMSLPKQSSTTKFEVPIIIENGQLFFVKKNLTPYSQYNREFMEVSAADPDLVTDGLSLRTKKNAGIPAADEARLKREIAKHLSLNSYPAFILRTNSFKQFSKFRDVFVASGFEYRLILEDGAIGTGSNVGAKTQ